MQPASWKKNWGIIIASIFIKVMEILNKVHISMQMCVLFIVKQFLIIIITIS